MKKLLSFEKQIQNQVNNTLYALSLKKIIYTYNPIFTQNLGENKYRLSWNNHISGKFNTGECFTKLEQYKMILKNNSYHCILYDGSIIRVSYTFEDECLIGHNLLWWPAPFKYEELTLEEYTVFELLDFFLSDQKWDQAINMRSPIRIDFEPDPSIVSDEHPPTHMHIEHKDCRMKIEQPLCFNKFINFILKNYYPDIEFYIDSNDYIEFKLPPFYKNIQSNNDEIILKI